ncbi:TPA: hypothetical protein NOE00_002123 [Pseudomonas aeruginosa]|nr:hypothetical protein [Pseudomonas aeruginosa]
MTLMNQLAIALALAARDVALLFFFLRNFADGKANFMDDVCTMNWPRPKTGAVI